MMRIEGQATKPDQPYIRVSGVDIYRCDHRLNGVDPMRGCAYCVWLVTKRAR